METIRSPRHNIRLLAEVARLYYEEGLTQLEVSEKVRVSRSTVSRMLQAARELGVVQIKIRDPYANLSQLEESLRKKYALREVLLVTFHGEDQRKDSIGEAAAFWLERNISEGCVVGASWGTTLSKIPRYLGGIQHHDCQFVSLVGGISQSDYEILSNQIVLHLSKALGGTPHFLHAPVLVDSQTVKESLVRDKGISEILELGKHANIALVGIGAPITSSTMFKAGFFAADDFKFLREKGAVGEICARFFDENGSLCESEVNDRVIGLELSQLGDIETVVGIAGGPGKVKAITAALKGGCLDVLITDEETGRLLADAEK